MPLRSEERAMAVLFDVFKRSCLTSWSTIGLSMSVRDIRRGCKVFGTEASGLGREARGMAAYASGDEVWLMISVTSVGSGVAATGKGNLIEGGGTECVYSSPMVFGRAFFRPQETLHSGDDANGRSTPYVVPLVSILRALGLTRGEACLTFSVPMVTRDRCCVAFVGDMYVLVLLRGEAGCEDALDPGEAAGTERTVSTIFSALFAGEPGV